jgi:acyl-CoA synthetase (NDP forming)
MLEGKKTYLTALVLGVAAFARALGWITPEQYEIILGVMGSLGLAALRAGVAKG